MKLSVRSDYAARALLSLARAFPAGHAKKVEELAEEQAVPANYLIQILIDLKAKGLVRSQRGKDGGYFLARPPVEIRFGDVLRAVHGQVFDSPALGDPQCPAELRAVWNTLKEQLERSADGITFQDLLEQGAEKGKMYYI